MSKISEITEKVQTQKIKPTENKISIGGMTYVIVSHFSDTYTDSVKDKIENGNIGTVITKDLSRFGRNYLLVQALDQCDPR